MSGSVCDDVDSGVVAGGLGTRAHAITEDLVGFSSEARASGSSAGRRLPVSGGRGAEGTGLDGTGAALRVAAAGSGSAGVTTGGSGAGVSIGVPSCSGAAGTVAGGSCATSIWLSTGGGRCSFTSSNGSSSSSSSSLTSVAVASPSVASSSLIAEPASEPSPKGRSSSSTVGVSCS